MARVSTEIKRLFVRLLQKSVDDGEVGTLYDALINLAQSQFDLTSSGEIAIARSADGFSGTFAIPNPGMTAGVTPVEITALASELLDLYDLHKAFLVKVAKYGLDADEVDENGWPSPLPAVVDTNPTISDSAISTRILFFLVPKTQSMGDYSFLDNAISTT